MKSYKRITIFIIGCLLVGAVLAFPIQAKVGNKNHSKIDITKKKKRKNPTAKQRWVRAWTKRYAHPRRGIYTKKQSNGKYYTKGAVDTMIANYLTSTAAASTYLTQSAASGTYLAQSTAASIYLPFSGGTLSGSLTATDYNYSSAASKSLSVNSSAFQPLSDLVLNRSGVNLGVYKTSGTASTASISVNLPHGAIVTGVTTYYYDNDNTGAWLQVQLVRDSLSVANQVAMTDSGALSSGTPQYSSSTDSSVDYSTIDNDTYNYHLQAVLSSSNNNCTFRSVKINYTVVKP